MAGAGNALVAEARALRSSVAEPLRTGFFRGAGPWMSTPIRPVDPVHLRRSISASEMASEDGGNSPCSSRGKSGIDLRFL